MSYDTWKTTEPEDTAPLHGINHDAEIDLLRFEWTELYGPVSGWPDETKLAYNREVERIKNGS